MKKLIFYIIVFTVLQSAAQSPDRSNYVPMPVPQWSAPLQHTGREHFSVAYDQSTQTETVTDNSYPATNSQFRSKPYIPPGAIESDNVIGQKNFNDLEQVSDPSAYPWCTTVKLFMTFPSKAQFVGSGVLINSQYVLTAGHCVYNQDNGGWATSIEVVPGYNSGNEPFGSANSTNLYSWNGWTNSHDYDWDMGYIKLDQAIGDQTGWLGFGYNNDDNFFSTSTFHNPGYPAESPHTGELMYYWYGIYDQVQTNRLYFNKYCYGGQSGSGSYFKDGSNDRYVYAELSHYNSINGTGHIRITQSKYNSIHNQIFGGNIGVHQTDNAPAFSIYPNPAKDQLTIEAPQKSAMDIFNIRGQLIKTFNNKGLITTIDLSDLPGGVYFLKVKTDNGLIIKRFIKE